MPFDNVAAMERLRANFASWPACAHCGEPSADHFDRMFESDYGPLSGGFRCPTDVLIGRPQYEPDKYKYPFNRW